MHLFSIAEPKLIAPVVAYLCHESNTDNGAIIESAAGWATKLHTIRGKGSLLRSSLSQDVTPENVRDAWEKVTDMSNAERMSSITEATGSLVELLDKLNGAQGVQASSADQKHIDTFSFANKDLILYALGGKLFPIETFYWLKWFSPPVELDSNKQTNEIILKMHSSWCQCEGLRRFEIFVRKSSGICTAANFLHLARSDDDNDIKFGVQCAHSYRVRFVASSAWRTILGGLWGFANRRKTDYKWNHYWCDRQAIWRRCCCKLYVNLNCIGKNEINNVISLT